MVHNYSECLISPNDFFFLFNFFRLLVSPYLKSLSMVAANKLLHLLEAFSTTWFLFSIAQNHHLVFFLLEVFNNIIQYQFDGEWLNSKKKKYQFLSDSLIYPRLNIHLGIKYKASSSNLVQISLLSFLDLPFLVSKIKYKM